MDWFAEGILLFRIELRNYVTLSSVESFSTIRPVFNTVFMALLIPFIALLKAFIVLLSMFSNYLLAGLINGFAAFLLFLIIQPAFLFENVFFL